MGSVAWRDIDEMNRIMAEVAPELASPYARFPLSTADKAGFGVPNKHGIWDRWYSPDDVDPKGKPCFVRSIEDKGLMEDYVWCKNGPNGRGYYHLMTKVAYTNLYSRLNGAPPGGVFAVRVISKQRQAYQDWDDVKRVVFNRYNSPRPDDAFGAEKSLGDAQGMAQAALSGDNPLAANLKLDAVKFS